MFSLKQDILCIVSVQKNLHVSFAQMISGEAYGMRMGPCRMWDLVGIDLFARERERRTTKKKWENWKGKTSGCRYRWFIIWDLTLVLVISCYIMLYHVISCYIMLYPI